MGPQSVVGADTQLEPSPKCREKPTCLSPPKTGGVSLQLSLSAAWTLKPRAPWNRNLRTESLEASVGPESDSRLSVSGDGSASDFQLWC